MQMLFSVIIPTYNGEKTIKPLIEKLNQSQFSKNIEIIIIDSSSTDKTVNIIKDFNNKLRCSIKIITVKKEKFNHGLTRNLGVKKAKGKYIYFLSQDALPLNDIFKPVISDFDKYKDAVVVFGKQIPFETTPYIQQFETTVIFDQLDHYINSRGLLIQNIIKPFIKYSENNYYLWYFLSDVCACYRRSFLLKNPFPKVGTGEDIIIGKYIIDQKMTKIYDSGIKIRHSHSYNLKQYFQRELGEHQLVTNNLKLKKDINIWYKIRKTFALKETFLTKLTILLQLPIYYLIKFFVFIKNKYGYKKIIDLCFLITTALFLLPSLNLRFIYSQGIGKLFLLLIFAYYGYKLISKKIKPKKNLFISLFIVFFISQVISVVNVVDLSLYIERFKSNIYIYLYFFVAIYILDDEVLSLKTIWLIIGCSVLNIFIKLLLFIDPINTISLLEKILYPGNSQLISMNINRGRIYFDSYDEIIFPLLAFFAYYNKKIRISLIFIGLTLVFISFVTNFRTNLIMILIGIFGSILIYTKKKNIIKNFVNKTIIVLLISAVMFLAYFIGSKIIGFSYVDRLVMSDKDEDVITVDQRIVNWSQAVEIGLSKPLFGTGLGNYNLYLPTQSKKSLFNLPSQEKIINEGLLHPHNLLVFTLAESGFFGLLSLLSLLIYFVFYDYQIFKKTPKLSKSLVVSFWVLFIFSLFNPTLYITYNILFWLLRILIYYENTNRWSHVRPS